MFFLLAGLQWVYGAAQAVPAADSASAYSQLLQEGRTAQAKGDAAGARAAMQAAIRLQPALPDAWCNAGVLSGELRDFAQAESLLRQCVTLAPGRAKAHYLLGVALIADPSKRLDWESANKEFRTAATLQSPYPEALARLGQGLVATSKPEEAIQILTEAQRQSPGSAAVAYNLGVAYEAAARPDDASIAYRRALTANPQYTDAALALAKLLVSSGKPAGAIPLLTEVLRSNPDVQAAHHVLSLAYRSTGKSDAAAMESEIAADLGLRDTNAVQAIQLSNEALKLAAQGDMASAEQCLREAIQLRPDYGVAHYNLGLILADRQNLDKAKWQLIQAVSLLPGNAKPLFDLSRVELLTGRGQDSQRELGWASRVDPASERIRAALGATAPPFAPVLSPSDLPQAWTNSVSGHLLLARELVASADAYGAEGQALAALAIAPADVEARTLLAQAMEAAGKRKKALLEYSKLLLVDPSRQEIRDRIRAIQAGEPPRGDRHQ